MQDSILRLMSYWSGHGCVLAQPYNTEVGAGTLNPATFLRVLGSEPWRTAYVEPSVRPDDSRYGENPNRMQTHTQFQVILKPDPGNSQELYLGSLQALGIDTRRHDVRFVEDNWESPALGAWGLGWEVWLDGLEITQFTYFQQAGGITLDPVSVEITYGLERILMALQGAQHFKDILFTGDLTYGEIQAEAELEMSTYYLDEADVATQRTLFDLYETQAKRLVELGLPLPAHSYVLKCSHAFNVLDSRGAVGANERASSFARMRGLAHEVAKLWLRRREELGHPLGTWSSPDSPELARTGDYPETVAPLLFEIGVEELPAAAVTLGIEQLRDQLSRRLDAAEIAHGELRVRGTPRRLVALVEDLSPRQPDRAVVMRGPRADVAFDPSGAPTSAGLGFARKAGMNAQDLPVVDVDGTPYVVVNRTEAGRRTGELLETMLAEVAGSLNFERNMRWGAGAATYPRPVRWVSALLGDAVVPFGFAGVASGRATRVGRDDAPSEVSLTSASSYEETMSSYEIDVDPASRRRVIVAEAQRLAEEAGGVVDLDLDAHVVDEVVNLVERPVVLLGRFDPAYLSLPAVVLTTVMKKHQRYLPVRTPQGEVVAAFVVVANGPVEADAVRAGNEAVLRARFADAAFFYQRDAEHPLEDFRSGLGQLVFEERAGSMLDRSLRIERLADWLGERLGLSPSDRATLLRAAHLAKADLTTEMVVEMSSLAGEMGRTYARQSDESPDVAEAIYEHVLPRFAGDELPASRVGAVLSVADRVDALVALFAVGAQPTGSSDPYGLRRAAVGLVQVCVKHDFRLPLTELFQASASMQDVAVPAEALPELHDFVVSRLERRLLDAGHRPDLVRAVTSALVSPAASVEVLTELEALVTSEDFRAAGAGYRRASRIARGTAPGPVDPELFDADAENALWDAWQSVADEVKGASSLHDFTRSFGQLVGPIDNFFDAVMVNSDDADQRLNRLRMLATVAAPGAELLDWESITDL